MPTVKISKIVNYSKIFIDAPNGKVIYYYDDNGNLEEIALDEDSNKVLDMVTAILDKLMNSDLILTGTIVEKKSIQSVEIPPTTIETYANTEVTQTDLDSMATDVTNKIKMKEPIEV